MNNKTCWYSKSTSKIEIKQSLHPPISPTKVADTVVFNIYDICQNISLQTGSTYLFTYTIITDPSITKCTVNITINSVSKYSTIYNIPSTLFN